MITLHDPYPPTGHRQTDLVAIVRVQGRWQGCVTHSGWQRDSSIFIASFCPCTCPRPCPCPCTPQKVTVRRKTVDATRMETKVPSTNIVMMMMKRMMMAVMMMYGTKVPSTTKPNFTVEEGVNIVPINGLSRLSRPWAR